MKYGGRKWFSVICLVLVFSLCVLMAVGKVMGQEDTDKNDDTVEIDWTALYPFADGENGGRDEEVESLTPFEAYEKTMGDVLNAGSEMSQSMPGYAFIGKAGFVLNYLAKGPGAASEYVKLNNGYWATVQKRSDAFSSASSTIRFKKDMDAAGIPFLYVQAPDKICRYDKELPYGAEDYTNENVDDFLRAFAENGVDYVDMREVLHAEGKEHYSMFYVTDHHWNVKAGLWAAGEIGTVLNEKYGFSMNLDAMNASVYETVVYPDAMFGSAGQMVTKVLADSEDFTMLYPKEDTDFSLVIPDKQIDARGTFQDLFMDYDLLNEMMQEGGGYAYETILYGNRPLVQITNYSCPDGPRVLMIRDSYAIGCAPYLAMGCSELDMLDVRKEMGNFTGSIYSYIAEMKPDLVLVLADAPQWMR